MVCGMERGWLSLLKVIDGVILLLIYRGVSRFNELYEKSKVVVNNKPYVFYKSLIIPSFDEEFIPALHGLFVRGLVGFKDGGFYLTSEGEKVVGLLLGSKLDEVVKKYAH